MNRRSDPEIALVHARLQQVRTRLGMQGLLDAVLIGLSVAAGLFLAFSIERRVWQTGLLPAGDVPMHLLLSFALAGVVTFFVALWRLFRRPDVHVLACRADRRFALQERLSTAIGLTATRSESAALRRALLADAAAHLPLLVPAKLAPFRPSASGLVWPVLAALGLAVVQMNPLLPDQMAETDVAATELSLDAIERSALAEDVTRVAEVLRDQAELRDDPHMAAVARTLDSLAERLVHDPSLTRTEAVAALSALGAEAQVAGRDWRGEAAARLPELVTALAEAAAAPPAPEGSEPDTAPGPIPPGMAAGLGGAPAAPDDPGAAQTAAGPGDDLDAMLDAFAQAQGQGQPAALTTPDGLPSPVVTGPYLQSAPPTEDQLAAQRPGEGGEPAQLLGPSANARAGESVLAGEGIDALDTGPAAPVSVTFETSGDFVLEANMAGEGRMMLRDLPPEPELSQVAAFDLEGAREAWEVLPPTAAWRDAVDLAARPALQTYFLSLAAEERR